jgi:hypothetical protein
MLDFWSRVSDSRLDDDSGAPGGNEVELNSTVRSLFGPGSTRRYYVPELQVLFIIPVRLLAYMSARHLSVIAVFAVVVLAAHELAQYLEGELRSTIFVSRP